MSLQRDIVSLRANVDSLAAGRALNIPFSGPDRIFVQGEECLGEIDDQVIKDLFSVQGRIRIVAMEIWGELRKLSNSSSFRKELEALFNGLVLLAKEANGMFWRAVRAKFNDIPEKCHLEIKQGWKVALLWPQHLRACSSTESSVPMEQLSIVLAMQHCEA